MSAKLKSVEQILTVKKPSVIDSVVGKHRNSVILKPLKLNNIFSKSQQMRGGSML